VAAKDIRQRVEIDTGDSVKEIRKVEDAATDTDAAIAEVDDREITVDADQALARLEEIKREAKQLADEKLSIKAELDAAGIQDVKRELDSIDTDLEVGLDVDHGRVNTTTTAINDVFSEMGNQGAASAIGISQAFNDAAEQAIAAFGPESGIARALTALGPMGTAALGAAAGGLLYWWQKNKEAAAEAEESVKDYIGRLEEASGVAGEAALAKVVEEFTSPGQIKAINDLGLSWTDVAKIVAGEAVPAWEDAMEVFDRFARGESLTVAESQTVLTVRKIKDALEDEESELRRGIEGYKAKQAIVDRTIEQAGGLKEAYEAIPDEVLTELKPYISPEGLRLLERWEEMKSDQDKASSSSFLDRIPLPSIGTLNVYQPAGTDGREVDRSMTYYERYHGTGGWSSNP
jgi:hypothetical protein